MEIEPDTKGDPNTKTHLVFLGFDKELTFDAQGTPLEDSYINGQSIHFSREIKDASDYMFGPDVLKPIKTYQKSLPIDPHFNCAGRFCNYFEEN